MSYKLFPVFPALLLILLFDMSASPVMGQITQTAHSSDSSTRIHESRFIKINGIGQWVTIRGTRHQPVILFIHGGPGSPISPYADHLYKELETEFILVQWDQRGTGKTYGRNIQDEISPEMLKANPLTIELMTKDGIELSEFLVNYLGTKQLILFGSSWGSALAVKMLSQRPDLYKAYVGHSQIVKALIGPELYEKVKQMASDKKDTSALDILTNIGRPPYARAKPVGQLIRIVKKYERRHSVPAPENWFIAAKEYDNDKDNLDRENGDDYSFVHFAGDEVLGVASMSAELDLLRDHSELKIPVYLLQGDQDILTPPEKTKEYYEALKAPAKEYVLVKGAGHGFNQEILNEQFSIFRKIKKMK